MKKILFGVACAAFCSVRAENLVANSSFELGLPPHGVQVSLPFSLNPVQPDVTVDESTAVHGKRSLKIDNTKTGGEAQLMTADVEFDPVGNMGKFVASVYVKADRPTKVAFGVWRVQMYELDQATANDIETFEVGTKWRRLVLRPNFRSPRITGCLVRLVIPFDCKVWVDALQFEVGKDGAPAEFAPAAPVEAVWAMDDYFYDRDDGETIRIPARFGTIAYGEVTDVVKFNTNAGAFDIALEPGVPLWRSVEIPCCRNGLQTLGGKFTCGTVSGNVEPVDYGVAARVPEYRGRGFRVGANAVIGLHKAHPCVPGCTRFQVGDRVWRGPLGYMPDDYYRDLRRCGFSLARFHDVGFGWEDVEKEKGKFDWTWMDAITDGLTRHGVEPLMVLGSHGVFCTKPGGEGPETNWFARVNSRPGKFKGKARFGRTGTRIFYHPADEDWTNWIHAVVSRYRGRILNWENVNEPNGTVESAKAYTHYAELAYKTIKSAAGDDETRVIGICSTGDMGLNAAKFFKAAGKEGAFEWLDAASFHPYAQPLDILGRDGESALKSLRQICDGFRPGVPLCQTENYFLRAVTAEDAAAYRLYRKDPKASGARRPPDSFNSGRTWPAGNLIRRYAIDLFGGCLLSTPCSEQHVGSDAGHRRQGRNLLTWTSFVPNDRALAGAAFARYLEGGTPLRKPVLPEKMNGFVFKSRDGVETALVWMRFEQHEDGVLTRPSGAIVRDLYGNEISGDRVTLTHEPIYVFGTDLFAASTSGGAGE